MSSRKTCRACQAPKAVRKRYWPCTAWWPRCSKPWGWSWKELELNGRGGWRAKLANNAVVQLGGGDEQELLQRTRRFARTLAQVAAQYQRRVDALESADLRHVGGYALKLRG